MIDDELRILDTKTKVKNTDSNFNQNSMVLPVYVQPASDTDSHSSLENFSQHEDNFEEVILP